MNRNRLLVHNLILSVVILQHDCSLQIVWQCTLLLIAEGGFQRNTHVLQLLRTVARQFSETDKRKMLELCWIMLDSSKNAFSPNFMLFSSDYAKADCVKA